MQEEPSPGEDEGGGGGIPSSPISPSFEPLSPSPLNSPYPTKNIRPRKKISNFLFQKLTVEGSGGLCVESMDCEGDLDSIRPCSNNKDRKRALVNNDNVSISSKVKVIKTNEGSRANGKDTTRTNEARYLNSDSAPFIVHIRATNDNTSNLHPLAICKTLSTIVYKDLIEVKKIGRGLISAELKNFDAANRLLGESSLVTHNLTAYIPTYRTMRTGTVKDVPQSIDIDTLFEYLESPIKVIEIHRLNRRTKTSDGIKYEPSRTLCFKFAGQVLPQYIYLFRVRHEVCPFVPKAKICYSCFRVGHVSKSCKGRPRCIYCGEDKHDENITCQNKNKPPRCVNCSGSHLPTSHECPLVINFKRAQALAAATNIPMFEAKRKVMASQGGATARDARYDYRSYPLPLVRDDSPAFSLPAQNSHYNRFNLLTEGGTGDPLTLRCRSYADVTSSHPNMHSDSRSPRGQSGRGPGARGAGSRGGPASRSSQALFDVHRGLLLCPDGNSPVPSSSRCERGESGVAGSGAFPASAPRPFLSSPAVEGSQFSPSNQSPSPDNASLYEVILGVCACLRSLEQSFAPLYASAVSYRDCNRIPNPNYPSQPNKLIN